MNIKQLAIHLSIGVAVPILFLFNAFVIPEPYSHPLMNVAMSPTHFMPFLEDRDLLEKLTMLVFNKTTPNFAPITIIILIGFWFLLSIFTSVLFTTIKRRNKTT